MTLIDDSAKITTLAPVNITVARNYPDTIWTTLNIDRMKALIAQKLSASQIAAALSKQSGETFSRNAIIGKARRLGIPLLGDRASGTVPTPKQKSKPKPVALVKIKAPTIAPPQTPTLSEVVANPKNVTILDIQRGECYWPTGHNGQTVFCGHLTGDKEKSWCPAHSKLGYAAPYARQWGMTR